jgi:protein phosphatase
MWVRGAADGLDRLVDRCERRQRRQLGSAACWVGQSACYMVYGMAELDPEKRGMSTTMSVLLLRGGRAGVGQVGDSRVYRLRGRAVAQLTEDHTLINYKLKQGLITAEEAKKAGNKNVITRAVGHRDYVQVDTADVDVAVRRPLPDVHRRPPRLPQERRDPRAVRRQSIDAGASAPSIGEPARRRDNITALVVEVVPA